MGGGRRSRASFILKRGRGSLMSQLFLPQRKRLGAYGTGGCVGPRLVSMLAGRKERNLFPLPKIEPRLLGCPVRSLVTKPTELSRLGEYIGLCIIIISFFKIIAWPFLYLFSDAHGRCKERVKSCHTAL